jgi:hypothetical protein
MSQTDDNIKADKIRALSLAKECYAMKLELLTNATVVRDAIRFVASHAATTTERANADNSITVEGENSDLQESEENHSYDRLTSDVQKLTGKPSVSVSEYVTAHPEVFSTASVTS